MNRLPLHTGRFATCLLTHGDPNGLPLVLLHGSFATSRWWEPLFELLPDEFYAIAPDLRGAGGAPHSDDGYEIVEMADDLTALVDTLGLRGFDLIAHGSSAAIAVEYVLSAPEKARSLVLVNPAPIEGAFTPLEAMALLAQMRDDRPLLELAMAGLLPHTAQLEPALFGTLVDDAAAMAPAAFTAIADALNRWNRFGDARRLTLPTLLIWGDADPIVGRDTMTRTLVAIPGANNLEVLRGVGHAPMLEAPLLLAEKIVNFVSEDFDASAAVRRQALD